MQIIQLWYLGAFKNGFYATGRELSVLVKVLFYTKGMRLHPPKLVYHIAYQRYGCIKATYNVFRLAYGKKCFTLLIAYNDIDILLFM